MRGAGSVVRSRRSCWAALLPAAALALWPAGAALAAGSQVFPMYSGPVSPSSTGWTVQSSGDPLEVLSNIHSTGIANDQGFPVWEIDDDTTLGGIHYWRTVDPSRFEHAVAVGWTLRARLRVVPQGGATPPGVSAGLMLGTLADHAVLFGADSSGNLWVLAPALPQDVVIPGGSVHHVVEIVSDPLLPGFDVLVDGVPVIEDVPGPGTPATVVRFGGIGPGGVSQVRYAQVEWEVRLADCGDGIDNDGDSLLDAEDPGCTQETDLSELDDFECNDDQDNDGDGLIDLADPGCKSPGDDLEFHFEPGAPAFDAEVTLRYEQYVYPPLEVTTTGVVPVHAAGGRVEHLRVPSLAGVDSVPIGSVGTGFLTEFDVEMAMPAETLVAQPGVGNTLPVAAVLRYRGDLNGQPVSLGPIPLYTPGGKGLGVGGSWQLCTVCSTGLRFTAAPWTLGNAALVTQTAFSPTGFDTVSRQGFQHGPLSATSTAAGTSGVVQFVTPLQIEAPGIPNFGKQAAFATLRIHFIPEPVPAVGLASGALLLIGLGRRRLRRR